MPTFDKILELLKDGKWHNLKEINREAGLEEDKLEEIIGFFAEYKFIQLDKKHRRAKLMSSVLEFLTKTQQITEKVRPSRES